MSIHADPGLCLLLRQCQEKETAAEKTPASPVRVDLPALMARARLLCALDSVRSGNNGRPDAAVGGLAMECERRLAGYLAAAAPGAGKQDGAVFKGSGYGEELTSDSAREKMAEWASAWASHSARWARRTKEESDWWDSHPIVLKQSVVQPLQTKQQATSAATTKNAVIQQQQIPQQQLQQQQQQQQQQQRKRATVASTGRYDPASSLFGHLKLEETRNKSDEDDNHEQMPQPQQQQTRIQQRRVATVSTNAADESGDGEPHERKLDFITAAEKLTMDEQRKGFGKGQSRQQQQQTQTQGTGNSNKSLGGKRKFVNPMKKDPSEEPPPPAKKQQPQQQQQQKKSGGGGGDDGDGACELTEINGVPLDDPRLRNVDPYLLERVHNDILDKSPAVLWSDIAGLTFAKKCVQEAVVWPLMRPDIFCGLRGPPKGLLLFGPPGTGKTMIGKAIASESRSTFFNISASTLTSKWIGEGEKTVRALFAVARCYPRSVIFIDEIDSILTQRSESENEASRRLKTEFLIQLDGAGVVDEERILVVGATNRPQELDEAARRRLVKRLYIPLPEAAARIAMVTKLLSSVNNALSPEDMDALAEKTDGYSGSDIKALCQDAALGPIRDGHVDISSVDVANLRPVSMVDFDAALSHVRPSVSQGDLQQLLDWNSHFGSFPSS